MRIAEVQGTEVEYFNGLRSEKKCKCAHKEDPAMRVIRLLPFCVFFLWLGSQVLISETVYAMCCGCTTCRTTPWCSCPGQNGCAWYQCRTTDTDIFQVYSPTQDTTRIAKVPPGLDGLVYIRQVSACTREKLAMRLLGDAADDLRIEPIGADPTRWSGRALEVKVAAN